MGNKKPVLRRCIACQNQKEKNEMIRIVKPKDEDLQVDLTGKKNGRGAYICKSEDCLNKAFKAKKLERTFEIEVSEDFWESLRGVILG
ncbi:MAG: YlxR family protein [Clostridia bacterium]|nr:YlxR family protein [Clostridia bacterium]